MDEAEGEEESGEDLDEGEGEEESDEDLDEAEGEEESDEDLDEDEGEFDEDGDLDLNDQSVEEGEDFGDLPANSGEPPTDSMVLEESLPLPEPIDPFEPYTQPDPQSTQESSPGEMDTQSGSTDNDHSPPARTGEP